MLGEQMFPKRRVRIHHGRDQAGEGDDVRMQRSCVGRAESPGQLHQQLGERRVVLLCVALEDACCFDGKLDGQLGRLHELTFDFPASSIALPSRQTATGRRSVVARSPPRSRRYFCRYFITASVRVCAPSFSKRWRSIHELAGGPHLSHKPA